VTTIVELDGFEHGTLLLQVTVEPRDVAACGGSA